jgi:predicted RNA-binding protein
MCLSKAYLAGNGEKVLVMDDVGSVEIMDNKLLLKTLFGEEKEIAAEIKKIDFVANNIILEHINN